MKYIASCTIVGLLGTAPFLFGAASSSGGNFSFLAFPALLLQHAVLNRVLPLDDVQFNRWSVVAQFAGYFLIALLVLIVFRRATKKHNKSLKAETPQRGAP